MGSTLPFSYKEVVVENRTKYNVDKQTARRTYNGIVFDSELEMKYYRDVILPQVGSGSIVDYELQKSYELQSNSSTEKRQCAPSSMWRTFGSSLPTGMRK